MYFDEFITKLKKDLPGLILLFGDSESVISEGNRLIKEAFRQKMAQGTIQSFDGNDDSLEDVISSAQTISLFANPQLIAVQHAEKLLGGHSEAALEQVKTYFSNPNPSSTLVFLAPGLRKSTKAVAAFERMGWAVQCSDMPDWKLSGWLKQQAQARGLSLPEDAGQLLVQKVGPDLAFLQRALEQLSVFMHPQKAITLDLVKDLPVPGIESEIFPFLDAIGLRQAEKALQMMNQLQDGVDTGTAMMLYGRVRELLMIALGRSKGWNQSEAAEKLGLHPFRLKSLWEQATRYSVSELKAALSDLIHLQAGVVTGRLGKDGYKALLEWWVLKWGRTRMAQGAIR